MSLTSWNQHPNIYRKTFYIFYALKIFYGIFHGFVKYEPTKLELDFSSQFQQKIFDKKLFSIFHIHNLYICIIVFCLSSPWCWMFRLWAEWMMIKWQLLFYYHSFIFHAWLTPTRHRRGEPKVIWWWWLLYGDMRVHITFLDWHFIV